MERRSIVSLVSRWFLKTGHAEGVLEAIRNTLVPAIERSEPGTLTYLVHRPYAGSADLRSLPPEPADLLLFFERYDSPKAFNDHLQGTAFTNFVAEHADSFIQANGKPYTTVSFLDCEAGFLARSPEQQVSAPSGNRHPSVMFEILSPNVDRALKFYGEVFGWDFEAGDGKPPFHYVHFPTGAPPLLGGIGSANPDEPGFEAGTNFYLLVDSVDALGTTLDAVIQCGGAVLMNPTPADGYHFAMFRDPDGFAVGLIAPFDR